MAVLCSWPFFVSAVGTCSRNDSSFSRCSVTCCGSAFSERILDTNVRRKCCGGKRIMLLVEARERKDCAGAKSAAVCSTPLSGVGMSISDGISSRDCGSMYRYICVVKRLLLAAGVTQRVKGMRPSRRFVSNTSLYSKTVHLTQVWFSAY